MEQQELRQYTVEFHSDEGTRTIEGRAIPFNVWSPNREGFREMISPEAVKGVIENSDIKMLYNHDRNQGFLARSNKGKGKLKIDVRDDGVWFTFEAKKDNTSNYVLERIQSGELNETSFAFTVDGESWQKAADGVYERTITKFRALYDFSVVDNSYYGLEGAVGCKRFSELQEEERLANEQRMKEEEEKRAAEEEAQKAKEAQEAQEKLDAYYSGLKETYKDLLN